MKRRTTTWVWLDAICAGMILTLGEIEILHLSHALTTFLSIGVLIIGYAALGMWVWHQTATNPTQGHLQYIRRDQQATTYRWISDEEDQ